MRWVKPRRDWCTRTAGRRAPESARRPTGSAACAETLRKTWIAGAAAVTGSAPRGEGSPMAVTRGREIRRPPATAISSATSAPPSAKRARHQDRTGASSSPPASSPRKARARAPAAPRRPGSHARVDRARARRRRASPTPSSDGAGSGRGRRRSDSGARAGAPRSAIPSRPAK